MRYAEPPSPGPLLSPPSVPNIRLWSLLTKRSWNKFAHTPDTNKLHLPTPSSVTPQVHIMLKTVPATSSDFQHCIRVGRNNNIAF